MSQQGDLYIAELSEPRIRKVDHTTKIINTIAGTGTMAYRGEGGPASAASFASIGSMTTDTKGNLYVVDYPAHRIRKIDAASGIITTVVGNGEPFYCGDGGPALAAGIDTPAGLEFDSKGNLFFADRINRVRMVDPSGKIVTVAGNGKPGFSGDGKQANDAQLDNPRVVGVDAEDNIYLYDSGHVRKLVLTSKLPKPPAADGAGKAK